jgi:RNA polymerase sigma factor (sigma-70 family)
MTTADPTQFLDALKDSDERAWERFYDSHLSPLRQRLARHFQSLAPEEIDDIWSLAIEKICLKVQTVKTPAALGGWIWTVARNTGLTYISKKKVRRQVPIIEEILEDTPATDTDFGAVGVDLLKGETAASAPLGQAFEELPPVHRSLLLLRVRDEMPNEVIYYLTGLSPTQTRGVLGNVRSRFRNTTLGDFVPASAG